MLKHAQGSLSLRVQQVIFQPAETKKDSTSKMEPTSMTGVFAGYDLARGCRWNGIFIFWCLEEFATRDLSTKSSI